MHRKARKAILVASTVLLASAGARAQPADPIGQILGQPAPAPTYRVIQQLAQSVQRPLSYTDAQAFGMAMAAHKRGDVNGVRSAIAGIGDPVARKTATWALVDANAEALNGKDKGSIRLRSALTDRQLPSRLVGSWTVDVETQDGQLVGRVSFSVAD